MMDKDPNSIREHVWLTAWVSVATANDCKASAVATTWADACLADFDKRFPRHTEAPTGHAPSLP